MKYVIPFLTVLALSACQQRTVINGDDIAGAGGDNAVYDEYGQLITVDQSSFAAQTQSTPDRIVLSDYTQEQQKRDREEYARQLDVIEANRVVIDNANVPSVDVGVNPAAYARSTNNQVGVKVYSRSGGLSGCGKYRSGDAAQRAFLENGGPQSDPLSLDKDGDGFACNFNPNIYRSLRY